MGHNRYEIWWVFEKYLLIVIFISRFPERPNMRRSSSMTLWRSHEFSNRVTTYSVLSETKKYSLGSASSIELNFISKKSKDDSQAYEFVLLVCSKWSFEALGISIVAFNGYLSYFWDFNLAIDSQFNTSRDRNDPQDKRNPTKKGQRKNPPIREKNHFLY